MMNTTGTSPLACFAVCAFGALSLFGGWLVIYLGGFHSAIGKYTTSTIFVDGAPALFMALLQFLAAGLAFTWALRRYLAPLVSSVLAFGFVFVPPMLFLAKG